MSFDFWGFTGSAFLSLPPQLLGLGLLGALLFGTLWLLWAGRASLAALRPAGWAALILLALAGLLLAQLFILRVPANILPPPGLPVVSRRPGLPFFALVPAFLAGGWLGVGPAVLVGLATGLSRAAWETYSWATPLEYAITAGGVAWLLRQDYRGPFAALLRQPLLAAGVVAVALWPMLLLGYFAYSQAADLTAWDYIWSRTLAAVPVWIGQVLLAGVIAQLARLGLPAWWPELRGRVRPPWVTSLNRRVLFMLSPLFLAGIGLLWWANVSVATDVSRRLVLDQMATAAGNAGRGIPFFIQSGQSLLGNIALRRDWLAGAEPDRGAALGQELRAVPFFRQLSVFDADLAPVAGYPAGPGQLSALIGEERQLMAVAQAGIPQQSPLYPSVPGQAVDVVFAVPLAAGADGRRGVLAGYAGLDTTPLMQAVAGSLSGLAYGVGQGFVVDEQGTIIFHPDPARLLHAFAPEEMARPLEITLAGATAYEDKAPDGTRRLVLLHRVPGHPWTVVVMVPNHVVLALATQMAMPIAGMLLAIAALGLALVSLMANRLAGPARALAAAAQRISDGQLDAPVVVEGEDEIGRAGQAFEHMRQRLRARLEELNLLLRVSQGVASGFNLAEGLPMILEGALSATGAAGARLVLAPGDPVFAAGPAAEAMARLDRDVLGLVEDEGRAVIEHLARARAVLNVEAVAGHLQALIALPLRLESTFFGALWLAYDKPHTFSESEISFVTTLAGQAAVAVANARLFEAAEQGRQRLAAILASTPDGIIVTDHANRLLLVNPAAEAAFGLTGKPVVGCPVAQALGPAHRDLADLLTAPAPSVAKAAAAGGSGNGARASATEPLPATGEFASAQGRTLFASASPIISADGSTLGRVCVLRDVTHFKQLDEMKSEFVATVSHDLRAPLTLIRGYATMLPMVGALSEKQKFFADKILSSSEQMTALINDLLDLGRIEAGVGLVREAVAPQQLIAEVIERVTPQAASGNLKLQVEAPAALPSISGDPVLLRQALTNLVENAIKYTGVGGEVVVRARLTNAQPGPAGLVFTVSDTGVGIAPADQPHLFEKFFRVRQRGRTQAKGSGLGLAIVRSIVERHGGRVWVESQLGAGSTFSMIIPLQPEHAPG